jgi:hypothetical protein
MTKYDKLVKSPNLSHAPAFAGACSAKAGIQNYLKNWMPAGMTVTDDLRLFAKPSKYRSQSYPLTEKLLS